MPTARRPRASWEFRFILFLWESRGALPISKKRSRTSSSTSGCGSQPEARLPTRIRRLERLVVVRNDPKITRILIAKVGLDGHDRGVKVVARCLRDAGMEVIYTGLHRRPEEVVRAAIEEDVDIIGISLLSGAHLTLVRRILEQLRQADAEDIIVVVGGVIPDEDVPALLNMGVARVFSQETSVDVLPHELH